MTDVHEFVTEDRYIDNGFYRLTEKEAKELCAPAPLPRMGYARDIIQEGVQYTVQTTVVKGENVWSLHGGDLYHVRHDFIGRI